MSSGITKKQARALSRLADVVEDSTYLASGVAIASHLGHRSSLDLDLFVPEGDPTSLVEHLESMRGLTITSRSDGTVYLELDEVPVSIIRYGYPLLNPVEGG